MKRELQTYAKTLNNRLKGWDDEDIESNLVRETRANLEMFYNKYGIETDDNYFARDLDLTPEQEREYEKIMDSFGNKAGSSINEMKKEYNRLSEDYRARFNVRTFEDFINFTDKMKQSQNDKILKNIISSDQIAELYTIASQFNMSGDTVDELIIFEYESNQKFYDRHVDESRYNANDKLYQNMINILEEYQQNDEDDEAWSWD